MCILIHALKKKHVSRKEIEISLLNNSAGFFMAALKPDGTRDTIRTLDHADAMKFFDEKVNEDDEFVLHARVPSRGETSMENVHGWEENGIMFGHNRTITFIDPMMQEMKWTGTDSEFFFRKLFIPHITGLGNDSFENDGMFSKEVDAFANLFAGDVNKFLFILPNNKVVRYGKWLNDQNRTENGEIAFWASNDSYIKVYGKPGILRKMYWKSEKYFSRIFKAVLGK